MKDIQDVILKNLKESNIEYTYVEIVHKKWGYFVETKCDTELRETEKPSFNALFDNNGKVIKEFTRLGPSNQVSDGIYSKYEVVWNGREDIVEFKDKTIKGKYTEIDDNHFIIPILREGKQFHVLFYIDENNVVQHKDDIEGHINEINDSLKKDKVLRVRNQEKKDFLYSWDRGCKISDEWDHIYTDLFHAREKLRYLKNSVDEMVQYFVEFLKNNAVYLCTLELHSKDDAYSMELLCIIGLNGLPVTDLLYVSDEYELKSIGISKENIGELEGIRKYAEQRLDKKSERIENNKRNIMGQLSLITSEISQTAITDNTGAIGEDCDEMQQ